MRRVGWIICFLAVLTEAGAALAPPSGSEVLRRVREHRSAIRDYTVDVDLRVQMENVNLPDVSIRVYYKHPDKTKVEPIKGFAIVPRGALPLGDPLARFGDELTAKVVGKAVLAGRPVLALELTSKEGWRDDPVEVWVDSERWLVLRMRSATPSGEPLTIDIRYERHQNRYWLPSRTVARLPVPESRRLRGAGEENGKLPASQLGTVTATFRGYRINSGLPDSLFEEEPRRGGRR